MHVSVIHACVPWGECTRVCKRAHARTTCSMLTGHVCPCVQVCMCVLCAVPECTWAMSACVRV